MSLVTPMRACPSRRLTTSGLSPARSKALAWKWRRSCSRSRSPRRFARASNRRVSFMGFRGLTETYQWLLAPAQDDPTAVASIQVSRLSGAEALAVRASRKLRNDEGLFTIMAGTRLRMELDKVPLWRGDHVSVAQLAQDFARYQYLPRLKDTSVLFKAIEDGVGLMLWRQDGFAYADSFDEVSKRYRGLRAGTRVTIGPENMTGLLVEPEVAERQMAAEAQSVEPRQAPGPVPGPQPAEGGPLGGPQPPTGPVAPKRFHGSVTLDAERVGRDAGRIAEEIIAHLAGLTGANVKVTLEIEAEIPTGAPDQVVRTVTENSRTLKFTSQGFEKD